MDMPSSNTNMNETCIVSIRFVPIVSAWGVVIIHMIRVIFDMCDSFHCKFNRQRPSLYTEGVGGQWM